MATELGQAYVQIMPSAKGISGSIQKTLDPEAIAAGKSAGSNIASSISSHMGKAGSSLTKSITLPVAAAGAAVGGLVAAFGWGRLKGLDSAQAQLKGLGYEVADVERISKQVNAAVQGTTMTMAEGTSVAAGALAAGVAEGADLERYIKQVGNAAVGANRPINDMAQIFNRVQGSGKLMTQELNMIEDGMPGFAMAMADSLGVPQAEFRKMVTAGQVSSGQFLDVMEGFAGDMSEAYSNSWAGMVSNTKAYIGIIGESILGGVFEQSKESIGEFMEYLKSDDVKAWAVSAGESIGNAFTKIIGAFKGAISWWTGLSDTTKTVITTLALLAVAIGPVLTIVSKMIAVVTTASKVFAALKVAASVLGVAIGAITAPVAIAIAAIAAIIAIGVLLYKNWDEIKSKATQLASWIKSTWDNIKTSISTAWNSIKTTTENVWNSIKNTITTLLDSIKTTFSDIFEAIKNIISTSWNFVKTTTSTIWNSIKGIITTLLDSIKTTFSNVFEAIKGVVSTSWDFIKDTTETIWNSIKDIITTLLDSIKTTFSDIFNSLKDVVATAFDNVRSAVSEGMSKALDVVTGFIDRFKSAGRNIVNAIADGIRAGINKVKDAISYVTRAARDYLPFSPAKEGALKDLDKLDFGTSIVKSIHNAKKPIQKAMDDLSNDTIDTLIRQAGGRAFNLSGGQSGKEINIIQNIYSPEPLTPSEVARQTKNATRALAMEW